MYNVFSTNLFNNFDNFDKHLEENLGAMETVSFDDEKVESNDFNKNHIPANVFANLLRG